MTRHSTKADPDNSNPPARPLHAAGGGGARGRLLPGEVVPAVLEVAVLGGPAQVVEALLFRLLLFFCVSMYACTWT